MIGLVPLIAAVASLGLVAVVVGESRRTRLHWSLALGLAGFAVEAFLATGLLSWTDLPEDRLAWLQALSSASLALLLPWGLFVAAVIRPSMTAPRWRLIVAAGTVAVGAAAATLAVVPAFVTSELAGPFHAARLGTLGTITVTLQLVATVGILAGLEIALRTSERVLRWRIKYLILGLGGVFLMRFYFLGQMLFFHVLLGSYLTTQAAALVLGNVLIGASLLRDRFLGVELTVSRQLLHRSVVIVVLGVYLVAVGALGGVLNRLGIAEDLFWGSIVIFAAVIGLGAVTLSEDVRWRVKRFIGLNFYGSKYDYRQHWIGLTRRLGSVLTLDQLAPQLIAGVADAVGTARAVLYLADGHDAGFYPAAAVEVTRGLPSLPRDAALVMRLRRETSPVVLEAATAAALLPAPLPAVFPHTVVAVPLVWGETLTGIMLVGPERTGRGYTVEDTDFLETLGQQAASALAAARFSEALAQSREFEAFHRVSSFVVHDLKNSISALSLLSKNALANFDDPEFQRDALMTLSRTTDRMKRLLVKLSSAPEPTPPTPLALQATKLAPIVAEATASVARHREIVLLTEISSIAGLVADPEALLQVLQNLVNNAIEALEGRGTITVRAWAEHDHAVIAVADTGCGMSEDYIRRALFTPFRSTKTGGWGIGLYQAKGLVEAHGGAIEVESKLGAGTTFVVRLPLHAGRTEEPR